MATEKLYYKEPYIIGARCEIEDIIEKDGKFEVVLKSTPFFPEGGGQPSDEGFFDHIRVEYVHEEKDIVYHVVSEKPQGKFVNCKVDYDRRLDHMQQHSGEHLMSAAIFKLFNASNDGFHLGENYVTIDILMSDMSEAMIKKAEIEANMYVYRNEKVNTYFLTKEEASKLPLRKAIKADGEIRIVQMGENTDFSSCCGTHVEFTGEVGIIKIIKYEKYKGMTRIYVKCGLRALKDYELKHDTITEIARSFSTEASEVIGKIKGQKEEIVDLKSQISNLYDKIATKEAEKLQENNKSKLLVAVYENENFELLEKIYDKLKNNENILVLASLKDKKLILAQNGAFDFECGKFLKGNLKEFNGRGGGNAKRAQASFETEDLIKKYIEFLKEKL